MIKPREMVGHCVGFALTKSILLLCDFFRERG
jgi:hypothetical protein